MTIRVYYFTPHGRQRTTSRVTVRMDVPYRGRIGGEWPPCQCPRHRGTRSGSAIGSGRS